MFSSHSDSGKTPAERGKFCASCGASFSCFTENCWCSELPNIMPMDETKGCLCPECLGREIEQKIKNHTSPHDLVRNRR